MAPSRSSIVLALSLLVFAACRTTPLPEPILIEFSPGLSRQQVEVAIFAGILNKPPPPSYDPRVDLSSDEFDSMLWTDFVSTARGRSWFPESRDGDTIYTTVNTRGLYLRAGIEIQASRLVIRIVESRNLEQSESRIHKRALKWLRNLELHITRELGRISVLGSPGG